jgi:hypothetical protein
MNKDTLTKEEKSLLLFFETRMVDNFCKLDTRHMNVDDHKIADRWVREGEIAFGRIPYTEIVQTSSSKCTHFVILFPEALNIAEELRKERALRQIPGITTTLAHNTTGKYESLFQTLVEKGMLPTEQECINLLGSH